VIPYIRAGDHGEVLGLGTWGGPVRLHQREPFRQDYLTPDILLWFESSKLTLRSQTLWKESELRVMATVMSL
jgi:hypothetical protein